MNQLHLSILGQPLPFGIIDGQVKNFTHPTTGATLTAVSRSGGDILTISINGPKPKQAPRSQSPIIPTLVGIPLGDVVTISIGGPKPAAGTPRPWSPIPAPPANAGRFAIEIDPSTQKTLISIGGVQPAHPPAIPVPAFRVELEGNLAQWNWRLDPATGNLVASAHLREGIE